MGDGALPLPKPIPRWGSRYPFIHPTSLDACGASPLNPLHWEYLATPLSTVHTQTGLPGISTISIKSQSALFDCLAAGCGITWKTVFWVYQFLCSSCTEIFYPRDAMLACVCLSVCLSQVGLLSKRLNESSRFWHGNFLPAILHHVKRKFGYLPSIPLELFSKLLT